jgi:hypothetical protein
MVKRAEVTLGLEIGKEIDYSSCTDAENEFITVLVANPHLLSLKWFGC